MRHDLKILRQHYLRVKGGTKTFEIRKNDRFFQKGDELWMLAWDENMGYMDEQYWPKLIFTIGDVYPIDSERVVFSLLKCDGPSVTRTEEGK